MAEQGTLEGKTEENYRDKNWVCVIVGHRGEGKEAYDILTEAGFYVVTIKLDYSGASPDMRHCGRNYEGLDEIRVIAQKRKELGIEGLFKWYEEKGI